MSISKIGPTSVQKPAELEEKLTELEKFRQGVPYVSPEVLQQRLKTMVSKFEKGFQYGAFAEFSRTELNNVLMDLRSMRSQVGDLHTRLDKLIDKFSPVSEFYNRNWEERSSVPESMIFDGEEPLDGESYE